MYILGINAYHGDASSCLLKDGILIAAVEEERFRRVKHWAGFPTESIRYCLDEAGITLNKVDHIAINSDPKASLLKKVGFALKTRPDLSLVVDRIRNQKERQSVEQELAGVFGDKFTGTVHQIEHHISHLSSCFHVSPFEEAVTVSVDGFGDFSSAAWGVGRNNRITVDGRVYFPHSLGIFYQALTQYLGFPNYGDEYKVMGLAPYGKPVFLDEMRQIVNLHKDGSFSLNTDYFRHHKEKIKYEWSGGSPAVGTLHTDKLAELLGDMRQKDEPLTQKQFDIARSIQAMYEEAFFHLLNVLHKRYGLDDLTLAGGCAMNSVANGKVKLNTPFKRVYIQSAAGDAGGAIGAAYTVWYDNGGDISEAGSSNALAGDEVKNRFIMDHAFWGPHFNNKEIETLLEDNAAALKQAECKIEYIDSEDELCKLTAQAISEGQVIGWFQGRMEWGPRALGNRSIVCDPRRDDMKDILNLKIKRRESFRPFAPSILRDHVSVWFEKDDDVPFMMKVFQIREEKRDELKAVTHVNGSGRLQTVYKETNPRYHKLIESFHEKTGVPVVLNTSFNENEPVVCQPKEALDCFLRTKMDLLVMENWMVRRNRDV